MLALLSDLALKRSAAGAARHLHTQRVPATLMPDLCQARKQEGSGKREAKLYWKEHTDHSWQTQPGAGNIYHEAIGELQVTKGILHDTDSEFMYFTNLISWGWRYTVLRPPPTLYKLEINSSLAVYQRMMLTVGAHLSRRMYCLYFFFFHPEAVEQDISVWTAKKEKACSSRWEKCATQMLALASCSVPVLQIVPSGGDLNG